ncbi:matrix-remodeling-associated protein 7 isoform X1 [Nematolebias whitei]|uniref:matrix-remodeling-associated protein 7 isoform X1 n=1 Tax=Nematolebias whitei TaxID=451745 RepID=UPI00189B4ABC|nr:matrix-remodeling-associated protein 7 isoform X1 [Nematolebias whitei]
MDATFILSAIIVTLLAVVVATSLLGGASPAADFASARRYLGPSKGVGGEPERRNGHVPTGKESKKEAENWSEISGSSHDHWDVVKSVHSEQEYPDVHKGEAAEQPPCTSSLSVPSSGTRPTSLEVDQSSPEALSGTGRRSFIGLSDTELLKCAFSYPQTEGAPESPWRNTKTVESDANNSLKYVPGKARSHHLEMMMSKEELVEEQRVQREQLASIFQLLKDNKETFGDVSEGELEEQLRLYSI